MRRGMILSLVLSLLVFAGCSGGGGGSPSVSPAPSTSSISGVASKGPISGGTVRVYGVTSAGAKGEQIGTATTNSGGSYTLTIGSYTGPVIVEVAGGTYTDEATGATNVPAPTMRAVVNAGSSTTLAVTPLTEMAYREAVKAPITPISVNQANFLVGSLFNNIDIINTLPADATAPSATATPKQKEYAVILGGISQLAQNTGKDLPSLLGSELAVTAGKLSDQTAVSNAVSSFNYNANNRTGVSVDISAPVSVPTVTLQASKNSAYSNGIDSVTLTALFSTPVADNTAIAFEITSGTASFSSTGLSTATVNVKDGKAVVDVVSKTEGSVTVTAKLTADSTATAQLSFTAPPALGLSASASRAVANGADSVTITAMPASTSATGSVTFSISSGTGTFDNNLQTKTVALANGSASVSLVSTTPGIVEVTATYATNSPAKASITFVAPPTTVVTASKSLGVANASDVVTFTATPALTIATYTTVTFEITSGTATFDNGLTTKTVALATNGSAKADVYTSTVGTVEVTATYAKTSTGKASASFIAPLALSASRSLAIANNSDTIKFTAQATSVAGYTGVTFEIKSGSGTFDNGLASKTVALQNGTASADLKTDKAGSVVVAATYAVTSNNATVKFIPQPASAVVDVGLKTSYENVYFLAFRIGATSGSVNSVSMTAVPINGASGLVIEPIKQGDVAAGIAAIALTKQNTSGPGFNIVAGTPVARMTYPVTSGLPEFAVTVIDDPSYPPLGITDPANPIESSKILLKPSDFTVTVTYKDAAGNTL